MGIAVADERGRVTLGTNVIERLGRKFHVVVTQDRVIFIPISEDPLGELRRMGREAGIDKYSVKELKQMAREEAEKEVIKKHLRHVR